MNVADARADRGLRQRSLPVVRPRLSGTERRGRSTQDEITIAADDGVGWKAKFDSAGHRPTGEVNIHRVLIVQFDPFVGGLIDGRMIHDFVEDHHRVSVDRREATAGKGKE